MKMKLLEAINNINNLSKFVEKGYSIPFALRRAIKKNHTRLYEEYLIYDEQRKAILEKEDKQQADNELRELLNTEIDIEIIKVSVMTLENIDMPYTDELLLEFMLEEEE